MPVTEPLEHDRVRDLLTVSERGLDGLTVLLGGGGNDPPDEASPVSALWCGRASQRIQVCIRHLASNASGKLLLK